MPVLFPPSKFYRFLRPIWTRPTYERKDKVSPSPQFLTFIPLSFSLSRQPAISALLPLYFLLLSSNFTSSDSFHGLGYSSPKSPREFVRPCNVSPPDCCFPLAGAFEPPAPCLAIPNLSAFGLPGLTFFLRSFRRSQNPMRDGPLSPLWNFSSVWLPFPFFRCDVKVSSPGNPSF